MSVCHIYICKTSRNTTLFVLSINMHILMDKYHGTTVKDYSFNLGFLALFHLGPGYPRLWGNAERMVYSSLSHVN